jgi:translocator protein
MQTYEWYQQLLKPSWAPPPWLFEPVWSVLYTLIAISFGYVFYLYFKKRISFLVLLPFILNIIFNAAFTPLQFGLRSNVLAAVDIVFVLATLVWAQRAIYPYAKWVSYINIPYLMWVSFATILQFTITAMNL